MESDDINFINLNKICRICLCETDGLISIFNPSACIEDVVNMFADVQSYKKNGLSCHICPTCFQQAIVIREFKRKCESSNFTLSSYFENVKEENPLDIDLPDTFVPVADYISRSFDLYDNPADLDRSNVYDQSLTADFFKYDCVMCEKIFPTSKELTSHILEEHNTLHSCDMCKRKFHNTFDLMKHRTTHKQFEVDGKRNVCPICKDIFEKYDFLQRHMSSHVETSDHQCERCGCFFTTRLLLKRHIGKMHYHEIKKKTNTEGNSNSSDRIELLSDFDFLDVEEIKIEDDLEFADKIADEDGSNFNITNLSDDSKLNSFIGNLIEEKLGGLSDAELGQTMVYVPSPKLTTSEDDGITMYKKQTRRYIAVYNCYDCSAKFKKYKPYRDHMKVNHNKEEPLKPFTCSDCNKGFNMRRSLKRHIAKYHQVIRECYHCSMKFRSRKTIETHLKKHMEKYVCTMCGETFKTQMGLRTHTTRKHANEPKEPLTCNICGRKFLMVNHLRMHLKSHSDIFLIAQIEMPEVQKRKKRFCDICGKLCSSISNLLYHKRRTHTNQKTCKCELCGKDFFRTTELKTHMRTHTGERPYVCNLCGKGFIRSDKLCRHMRSHDDLRPFACNCGSSFRTLSDLNAHMKRQICLRNILKIKINDDNSCTNSVGPTTSVLDSNNLPALETLLLAADNPLEMQIPRNNMQGESTLVSGKVNAGTACSSNRLAAMKDMWKQNMLPNLSASNETLDYDDVLAS